MSGGALSRLRSLTMDEDEVYRHLLDDHDVWVNRSDPALFALHSYRHFGLRNLPCPKTPNHEHESIEVVT